MLGFSPERLTRMADQLEHGHVPDHEYQHAHIHEHHVLTPEEILPDDLPPSTPVVSDHQPLGKGSKILVGISAVCLALLIALVAIQPFFYAWQLRSFNNLAKLNNKVLTVQLPGLQAQIARDKSTINSDNNIINQEVNAIIMLAKKCEAAPPCKPGEITIKPPKSQSP